MIPNTNLEFSQWINVLYDQRMTTALIGRLTHYVDLIDEHERIKEERRYMNDFIHYKNLDEEFSYFKKHAHEDTDTELPFPSLAL